MKYLRPKEFRLYAEGPMAIEDENPTQRFFTFSSPEQNSYTTKTKTSTC